MHARLGLSLMNVLMLAGWRDGGEGTGTGVPEGDIARLRRPHLPARGRSGLVWAQHSRFKP